MRKLIAWSFLLVGALLGIVWYFDVNQAGEEWGDIVSDPVGTLMDLATRIRAKISGSVSDDPRTIALGLLAGFEGFVGHAYRDKVGVWTIGYGHKIVDGDGFAKSTDQTISQSDALALLGADLDVKIQCVSDVLETELTPNQLAALYSFTYNEGCGAFRSSTLLRKINAGDLAGASQEFARWVYAGNPKVVLADLETRRADESMLFASDIQTDDSGEETA
jgi:lysozyme